MDSPEKTSDDAPAIAPELQRLARRLFWWKPPEEALANPLRFLAQVMTLGTWDDLCVACRFYSQEDFRPVLDTPPVGVFDARSWWYRHRVFGAASVPSLPRRPLP